MIADVSVAVYERYFGENDSNVGYAAHLGGAVAGSYVWLLRLAARRSAYLYFVRNIWRNYNMMSLLFAYCALGWVIGWLHGYKYNHKDIAAMIKNVSVCEAARAISPSYG